MLSTLQSLSGTTHKSYRDNKSVTYDARKLVNQADDKVTMSTSVHEMSVISKNDMLMIPRSNMMVFGHGHPIWNRNQMVMPYAYALHKNQLRDWNSKERYTLSTIPSTTNTRDFDLLGNQPNFVKMVQKRVDQARLAPQIREAFKSVYSKTDTPLTDNDLLHIDADELARDLMQGINDQLAENAMGNLVDQQMAGKTEEQKQQIKQQLGNAALNGQPQVAGLSEQAMQQQQDARAKIMAAAGKPNQAVKDAEAEQDAQKADYQKPRYGGGLISREALRNSDTQANLAEAYVKTVDVFKSANGQMGFTVDDTGSLYYNNQLFVKSSVDSYDDLLSAKQDLENPLKTEKMDPSSLVVIEPAFIGWIDKQDSIAMLANGNLDVEFGKAYQKREDLSQSRE